MDAYGDDCKISPGIIQGDRYTFLLDSKTALFVQEPTDETPPYVAWFFLAISIAVAVGASLDGKLEVVVLPCVVVTFFAAISLLRRYRKPRKPDEWKLFLGSTESPVLIYSHADATAFAAKRNEIEQALLGRPLSEEK